MAVRRFQKEPEDLSRTHTQNYDAECLDFVKDLELCTHDIQGVAVNFPITDRPEHVSFLVPEIAGALLKDKWKHDNTVRE